MVNLLQRSKKMLLVAAALCVGASASWADTTVTYDFVSWAQAGYKMGTNGPIQPVESVNSYDFYGILDSDNSIVFPFSGYYQMICRNDGISRAYLRSGSSGNDKYGLYFGSSSQPLQLKALTPGDKVVFTFTGTAPSWRCTNLTKEAVAVASGDDLVSGAEYIVTGDGLQNITLMGMYTNLQRIEITTSKTIGKVTSYDFYLWAKLGYSFSFLETTAASGQNYGVVKNVVKDGDEIVSEEVIQSFEGLISFNSNYYFRADANKKAYGLYNQNKNAQSFHMYGLNPGERIAITGGTNYYSGNLTKDGTTAVANGASLESGVDYIVGGETAGQEITLTSPQNTQIKNIVITGSTAETFSTAPVIDYNDGNVTITPATSTYGTYSYTYYTTDGTTPSVSNGNPYTGSFAAPVGTTIKAVTVLLTGVSSSVTSCTILPQPSVAVSAMATNGSLYSPTLAITIPNYDDLTVAYTVDGVDVSANVSNGTYNATMPGTFKVAISREGDIPNEITYEVKYYEISNTYDLKSYTASDLGSNWTKFEAQGKPDGSSNKNWSSAFSTNVDYYWYNYTGEGAGSSDVIDGLTVGINTGDGRAPYFFIGYGLWFPYNTISSTDGSKTSTVSNSSTYSIGVSEGTEDQIVGYYVATNYGGTVRTYFYNGNQNYSLPKLSGMLRTVTVYSPAPETQSATIGSTGYATFSSTYALDFNDVTDATAYIATNKSGDNIQMQSITGTVAAGTGLVLKSANGGSASVSIPVVASGTTYNAESDPKNYLFAVDHDYNLTASANGTNYVLSVQGGKVVFAPVGSTAAPVKAGHAALWIPTAAAQQSRALVMSFSDESTGIEQLESVRQSTDNTVYNLNGQRVAQPSKGLYIVGGKKVVVK